MKVKLENVTGDVRLDVDVEMTDTPINMLVKAIEQNTEDDVIGLFTSEVYFKAFKDDNTRLDTYVSEIDLMLKDYFVPLEWNVPIGEQIKEQLNDLINEGRKLIFICGLAMLSM